MIIEAITLGVGLAEGISSAYATRSQARQQLNALNGMENNINDVANKKTKIAYDMYGNKISTLAERVGNSLNINTDKYNFSAGKSGFEYSGTVNKSKDYALDTIRTNAKDEKMSLINNLGNSLLSIEEEKARQLGELEAQRMTLKAQSNQRFLGIF